MKITKLLFRKYFISTNKLTGEFLYLSDSVEEILGYKPKELIGKCYYFSSIFIKFI